MQDIVETVKVADPKCSMDGWLRTTATPYKFAYSTFDEEKVFFRFKEMSQIILFSFSFSQVSDAAE